MDATRKIDLLQMEYENQLERLRVIRSFPCFILHPFTFLAPIIT